MEPDVFCLMFLPRKALWSTPVVLNMLHTVNKVELSSFFFLYQINHVYALNI